MIRTKNSRHRDRFVPSGAIPAPPPLANVTSVVRGVSQATVNFDSPVQAIPGSPPMTWTFGATPRTVLGIVSATPTQLVFALSGTITVGDPYVIQAGDPAVRTPAGGYVAGRSGTMA